MNLAIRSSFLILLFAALSACQQLGVSSPTTFNEKLAIAYGTVTQVRTTATSLLQAKKISADDAQNVNNQADNARAGLDIARKVAVNDLTTASNKLTAVTTALSALISYLATKGN